MNDKLTNTNVIDAEEVANYVVCPEAWRLKTTKKVAKQKSKRTEESLEIRKQWAEEQSLSVTLRRYAKIAYMLLVLLVLVVFLIDHQRVNTSETRKERVQGVSQ